MADLSAIKSEINTDIVTNGVNAITADKLNDVLIDLCDAVENDVQAAENAAAGAVTSATNIANNAKNYSDSVANGVRDDINELEDKFVNFASATSHDIQLDWVGSYYRNSSTGALTASSTAKASDLFPKMNGLNIKTRISGSVQTAVQFWDSAKTYLGYYYKGTNGVTDTLDINDTDFDQTMLTNASYLSIVCLNGYVSSASVTTTDNITIFDTPAYNADIAAEVTAQMTTFENKFEQFDTETKTAINVEWVSGLYYRSSSTGALTASSTAKSSELFRKPASFSIHTIISGSVQTALQFWDVNQNYLGYYYKGTNGVTDVLDITEADVDQTMFANAVYMSAVCLNSRLSEFTASGPSRVVYKEPVYTSDISSMQSDYAVREKSLNWRGKTIMFLGTSIPAGGYPEIVCDMLGATCVNAAVGSSVLRKALRDGGGFTQFAASTSDTNYVRAFTATKAEKEALFGSQAYNQYSYEEILIPYLNGNNPAPDAFVIDYSAEDKVRTGKSDPYFAEINTDANALLPADYQLATDTLTSSRGVEFNRNSYTGALLFIVDLIWQYLPQAKIIVMGYLNRQARPRMMEAQKVGADYWQIPYYPISDYLGWSNRVIYGSMDDFNTKYSGYYSVSADVTAFRFWCPDGTHPHTNPTLNALGYKESNYEVAKKVAAFIELL